MSILILVHTNAKKKIDEVNQLLFRRLAKFVLSIGKCLLMVKILFYGKNPKSKKKSYLV